MTSRQPRYEVERHKRVKKFLAKHADLNDQWPNIERELRWDPHIRRGDDIIVHLKADLLCNYRWREAGYRFLYEIDEDHQVVLVFDVDTRGQVYQRR